MRLIIGNKNYSSWSLRPWLLLDAYDIKFEEQLVSLVGLGGVDLTQRLKEYSGSARVPVLQDGDLTVWDSLAICEYINDAYCVAGRPQDQSTCQGGHCRNALRFPSTAQ